MAEVVLDEAGIGALVGQRKTAGMTQHVGMGWQGQSGCFPIAAQERPEGLAGDRRPPGAQKQRLVVPYGGF